jgi:putative ABC transport system substrate-binding protein
MAKRRDWLCRAAALFCGAVVLPARAAAIQYRVGVITETPGVRHRVVEGLREGLHNLGFVEGRDITYDMHFTRGQAEAAAAAVDALTGSGVHLIFTGGERAALAAKKAAQRIPIVFTRVRDPVTAGLVATLPYPGGNLTGISSRAPELAPKRLEILKTLVPGSTRVWFIYDGGDTADFAALGNLYGPAGRLGLELLFRPVTNAEQLARALEEVAPGDALLAPTGNELGTPAAVHETALKSRIPVMFGSASWVSQGALASYGPDEGAEGAQAARLVARILRGARPQDLPVEGAEHIHLALNLKTAARLRLPIPDKLMFRVNVVYR